MSKVVVVFGEKSIRSGEMHPAFKERLDRAVKQKVDLIVITGGETKRNSDSEAKIGMRYIRGKTSTKVILEDKAKTTVENILFSKKLLERKKIKVDKVIAISSNKRMFRLRYLYWRLWSEVDVKFLGARDFYPFMFYLQEILYLIVNLFDPYEKTIVRLTRKLFRNGLCPELDKS